MSGTTERLDVDVDGLYSRISSMLQSLDALKRYKDKRSIELPKCADGEYVQIGDEIEHPNGERGRVIGIDYREDDAILFVLGDNGLAYMCEPDGITHACPMEKEGDGAHICVDVDKLMDIVEDLRDPWEKEYCDEVGEVNGYESWIADRILDAIGKGGAE